MRCLHSSCVTRSTMVTPCSCRTPSGDCWSEDTKIQSSYFTRSVVGPKTTMCLCSGGWGNMMLSWRRACWTQPAPLLPSSLPLWCMLDLQRWAAAVAYGSLKGFKKIRVHVISASMSFRFSGTAEPEWSPEQTFTLSAGILQVCLTQRLKRTCMSPPTVEKCCPWPQVSPL